MQQKQTAPQILLVDTQAPYSQTAHTLRQQGYTVQVGHSGTWAVNRVLSTQPAAVVVDTALSGMNSRATLRALRAYGCTCPIIAYDSNDSFLEAAKREDAYIAAGFDTYAARVPDDLHLLDVLHDMLALDEATPLAEAMQPLVAAEPITSDHESTHTHPAPSAVGWWANESWQRVVNTLPQHTAPDPATAAALESAKAPSAGTQTSQTTLPASTLALVVLDEQRRIVAVNRAAELLLNIEESAIVGTAVETLAAGTFAALPLRPGATFATTMFYLPNTKPVRADTRPLYNRWQHLGGWIVALRPLATAPATPRDSTLIGGLQEQMACVRALVALLPRFRQQVYWQTLLLDSIDRMNRQMHQHVQHMAVSAMV